MGDLILNTNGTVTHVGGGSLRHPSMGIQLGNLDIYNFLDYEVNRKCGGIVAYSNDSDRKFLENNLKNNFSGGLTYINPMSGINKTDSYGIPSEYYKGEYDIAGLATDVHSKGDDMGEYYLQNGGSNANKNFITKDIFEQFQLKLQEKNLKRNSWRSNGNNNKYENERPSYYFEEISKGENNYLDSVIYPYDSKGTFYRINDTNGNYFLRSLDEISGKAKSFSESVNSHIRNGSPYYMYKGEASYYKYMVSRMVGSAGMSNFGITDKVHDRAINGVLVRLDELNKKFRINNKLISPNINEYTKTLAEKQTKGLSSGNRFETILDTSKIEKLVIKTNLGQYEYSKGYRDDYKSKLSTIKNYPKLCDKEIIWNFSKMYGVIEDLNDFKEYSVGSENKFEEAKINPDYIGENSKILKHVNDLISKSKINAETSNMREANDIYGISENPIKTWRNKRLSQKAHLMRPFADGSTIDTIQNSYGTLRPNGNRLSTYSVLKDDGYVRMTPTHNGSKDITKCMFSIENLAWRGATMGLSEEQKGPRGGRIMWFPPYNLKFSENVNVSWNENNFIGRGEGIYTYTNTTRTGTLDFTLLIDHPSIINKVNGISDDDLLDFFYGIKMLEGGNENIAESVDSQDNNALSIEPQPAIKPNKIAYVIFFPENNTGINTENENVMLDNLTGYNNGINVSEEDVRSTIFNGDKNIEINFLSELVTIEKDKIGNGVLFGYDSRTFKIDSINIKGSELENENGELCDKRRTMAKTLFNHYGLKSYSEEVVSINDVGGDTVSGDNSIMRNATIVINIIWNEENVPSMDSLDDINGGHVDNVASSTTSGTSEVIHEASLTTTVEGTYTYDNEYLYFSDVMSDREKRETITKKISYFNPAFHSVTPEGFNARLTFLQQCTRQGPTEEVSSGNVGAESNNYLKFAGNLSFGRAPYCILRIGDFFNTKICIDSISITYDNNGVQWDLNPEGVGVQPMFANVSISFKFIGGQDISGPVARLQNAVTANYYANASVYSRHADTESKYYKAKTNATAGK
jgi:hypothetical protein